MDFTDRWEQKQWNKCKVCGKENPMWSKDYCFAGCALIGIQSELDAYKIALKYFVDNGGHGASDIADNLLREVTHG